MFYLDLALLAAELLMLAVVSQLSEMGLNCK